MYTPILPMFTVWMDNNEFYNKYPKKKITVEIGNYYNGFEWGWELLFDTYIFFFLIWLNISFLFGLKSLTNKRK